MVYIILYFSQPVAFLESHIFLILSAEIINRRVNFLHKDRLTRKEVTKLNLPLWWKVLRQPKICLVLWKLERWIQWISGRFSVVKNSKTNRVTVLLVFLMMTAIYNLTFVPFRLNLFGKRERIGQKVSICKKRKVI